MILFILDRLALTYLVNCNSTHSVLGEIAFLSQNSSNFVAFTVLHDVKRRLLRSTLATSKLSSTPASNLLDYSALIPSARLPP